MWARWVLAGVVGLVLALLAGDAVRAESVAEKESPAAGGPRDGFDPRDVWLGATAPETLARAALAAGSNAQAFKITTAALRRADPARRGRLRWLAAAAAPTDAARVTHLDALWKSKHQLRRWAGLELAERLRTSDTVRAASIAAELGDEWAGRSRARRLAAQLAPPTPAATPAAAAPPAPETASGASFEATLARGKALADARRYEDAERVFAALARVEGIPAATRCEARLAQGKALAQRRARKEAAELLGEVAPQCESVEVKAWARYFAGQSLLRSGDPKGAIGHYQALRREAPEHTLADDALLIEAGALADMGDAEGAKQALTALVEAYPAGDMRGEARMRLAFMERTAHAYTDALVQLDALVADGARAGAARVDEGAEGRAEYWRARTLEDMQRTDEAEQAYVTLIEQVPLSFHAQQGLHRLRSLRPASATKLMRRFSAGAKEQPLRFAARPELGRPEFIAAVEFLRVGEITMALRELGQLGATADGADADMLWLVAALLHHARAHDEAVTLVRKRLGSLRPSAPHGEALARWRIGYPHAFAPLVEKAAREADVPAALLRAIAREESSFDPEAVSSAHAYGLVQLIEPTARRYAAPLRLPSDPRALKRPEVNLRIGAGFVRDLWKRYSGNAALIPSAYNAGMGATDRWLSSRTTDQLDEWIETIPYSETRRYTRRVLQSYGVYSWLDSQELPRWPLALAKQ